MFTDSLFQTVLIDPVLRGADQLYIVSGYATAAMAFHHLETIRNLKRRIKVDLLVGMCPLDGLPLTNHKAFQKVASEDFPGQFICSYLSDAPPVHSKLYAWLKDGEPFCGYIGSANYTQMAFGPKQVEAMDSCTPEDIIECFNELSARSIYCTHQDAEFSVTLYSDKYYTRRKRENAAADDDTAVSAFYEGLAKVTVSLLDNHGNLPDRSGLNWGQRPEYGREPNQAYIRLPASVYHTDFFPEIKVHFTLLTDDGKILICTRAQANGKAIHTPHNNSLIGEYFRNRLGVPNGELVTLEHLQDYGRTDVDFYKVDDETYYMNFSV